jgi:transposase
VYPLIGARSPWNNLCFSGLHLLLALLDGRAAPEEIAGLARGSAKRKTAQLIEAIEGNRMSDHVRFLIRGCLRHLACLEEEVEELDAEILRRMQLSTFQKAFTLLQTIPGVGQLSAATILAETGPELDSFPTIEQMASWAGLCPGNRESAGIQKGPQTTHGNPYLCTALVQCAWAATRKRDSVFRSRFQRLAPRRGEKRARWVSASLRWLPHLVVLPPSFAPRVLYLVAT